MEEDSLAIKKENLKEADVLVSVGKCIYLKLIISEFLNLIQGLKTHNTAHQNQLDKVNTNAP